ncbi:hypothetical protein MPTK1_6g06530 [Marchantia polymorpha subsp. ruderalis]|uniref:GDSL esterase/lipase n=2 Tax=Marchantia polymorpha TaxID=3197 RepID=A0AAF6BP72_MARPO|nr:hypothetical protein MARPO_0226s0003 [Marchantia polymorpha]BBN13806.1 hypothetical protein Mp_6g06530 [Marchantia polymorpha subsp. ruderalis]|eukprot:PTQ27073.1 hypothetical protein MARPO_0226s0003 [Marchantia polymorpha]
MTSGDLLPHTCPVKTAVSKAGGCSTRALRMDVWGLRLLMLMLAAGSIVGHGTCDAVQEHGGVRTSNSMVSAMFVFGDSVVDAGTNSYFPSLLQANYKPYGAQYFGKPTGRFTNGRTFADFFAEKIGLPFAEPYLKRKGKWSIMQGVNYASAGGGIFRVTNLEFKVIPLSDQILQFAQTKTSIEQTLKSTAAAKELFSKSLFLINIGTNDLVTYLFNPSLPIRDYLRNSMDALEDAVKQLYNAGGRKFMFLDVGPIGCVPAIVANARVEDGTCLESVNDLTKNYNTALEELVLEKLPGTFKGIHVIIGKLYETFDVMVNNASAYGFTEGVTACCGSGLYNAETQCGRPADLITNPPYNLCDNVDKYVFWDYFHPSERAYGIVADKLWNGDLDVVAPMNLNNLVNLQ